MAGQGADVDEQVVSHVDSRDGDSGVDDDSFTTCFGPDVGFRMAVLVLLGDERGDTGFEEANSAAEEDETDDEGAQCTIGVGYDRGDGGNDDQDVTDRSETDGHVDGLELAPILVGNPAACMELARSLLVSGDGSYVPTIGIT